MSQLKHKSCKPQEGIKKVQNYLFQFSDFLGKGNFSSVYKGINEMTNQTVAIKYITLSSLNCVRLVELLDQQIQIFTSLNHPNIVKCYQVLKSCNNCYIITQLCDGGDLQGHLKKKGLLTENEAIPFIRDIFEGLYYLSKKNIIHRDIKIANIFLHNKKAKIADFGFAQRSKTQFYDGKIGTPLCMSPEGFIQNLYGSKTDVWAFGVIMYQLTHGRMHLDHCTSQEMLKENIQKQMLIEDLKAELSFDIKSLIVSCLNVNPCSRITFQEMRRHPFIQKISKSRIQPFSMQNLNNFQNLFQKPKTMNQIPDEMNFDGAPELNKEIKIHQHPQISFLKHNNPYNFHKNQKQNIQFGNATICEEKAFKREDKILKINLKTLKVEFQKVPVKVKKISTYKTQCNIGSLKFKEKVEQQKIYLKEDEVKLNQQKSEQKIHCLTTARHSLQLQQPMTAPLKCNKKCIQLKTQINQAEQNNNGTLSTQNSLRKMKQNAEKRSSNFLDLVAINKRKKWLKGFIKFNQAIGIIHYCRLLYKYIIELKVAKIYYEGNLKLKYYSNFLLNLLNELQDKLLNGHIIISKGGNGQDTKQLKVQKMQKVIQQYIERYKPNLQKQRSDNLNKTIEQIKQIIISDMRPIESFYIPDKSKIQMYHTKIFEYTCELQKSTRFQKYSKFDSNIELEDYIKQDVKQRKIGQNDIKSGKQILRFKSKSKSKKRIESKKDLIK